MPEDCPQLLLSKVDEPQVTSTSGHHVTEEDVLLYLRQHPQLLQRWQTLYAEAPDTPASASVAASSTSNWLSPNRALYDPASSRNSITDELFREMVQRRPSSAVSAYNSPGVIGQDGQVLNESEMMLELIRDIANEFDVRRLCHKIMRNVSKLTGADRGSLFLAKGSRHSRYLVAKVFDVCGVERSSDGTDHVPGSRRNSHNHEIRVPFGSGIAGYVAQTKETVNLEDAYKDERFNPAVDAVTGYKTGSLLCMPVLNQAGHVVAVAQIINKQAGNAQLATHSHSAFTDLDVQIFQRYLVFCGIGIQNAQLFELSISEFKKNQILLSLARGIFEQQDSLENLAECVMKEALNLLKCRQSVLMLRENCYDEMLSTIELRSLSMGVNDVPPDSIRFAARSTVPGNFESAFRLVIEADDKEPDFSKIDVADLEEWPFMADALRVLDTGQAVLNTNQSQKAAAGLNDHSEPAKSQHEQHTDKSQNSHVLSIPIYNHKQSIIGVCQFIGKRTARQFSDHDIRAVETFGVFCGLGVYNSQMHQQACRLMAKQRVTLECLSYHATASDEDTERLQLRLLQSADANKINLYSFGFNDSTLSNDETCLAVIGMFQEAHLLNKFKISPKVLCRWVLSVKKNYRPVTYHNWRHGLNVMQTMFTLLKNGELCDFISDLHVLGLLVGCLSHDLDHRGTNNAYQLKTESPLAYLYSTSTMEHHHFDQCIMILNADGNNILESLSAEEYRDVIEVVRHSILATDLALYFKKRDRFMNLVKDGHADWTGDEELKLLMSMMMTACDISAICKPWHVQYGVAQLVSDEFYYQGDLERSRLHSQPIAMMDREKQEELPKMQMGFIDFICMPLYKALADAFPFMKPLHDGVQQNRANWEKKSQLVERGMSWMLGPEDTYEEGETTSDSKFAKDMHDQSAPVPNHATITDATTVVNTGAFQKPRRSEGHNHICSCRDPDTVSSDNNIIRSPSIINKMSRPSVHSSTSQQFHGSFRSYRHQTQMCRIS